MELTQELNAEEGSFLLELRTGMHWDHTSFMNLLTGLFAYCQGVNEDEQLDRSMASGIYTASVFIKSWAEHPNFPKQQSDQYYTKSYEVLDELVEFYFTGTTAYMNDEYLAEKIEHLNTMAKP